MTVALYIICAILAVCMFILFTMLDRIKDIQDDLQLIRRRAFKQYTVESYDVSSMHPTAISTTEEFGDEYTNKFNELYENEIMIKNKASEKRIDDCVQDLSELKNEIDALKLILHDHEQKINDIYIEE